MERTKERSSFHKKFIGDRKFYMMVLAVAVPIMIQNGITNFVSLLDNIMIGRIGTEQMSRERVLRSRSQIRLSMESSIWILCCWDCRRL